MMANVTISKKLLSVEAQREFDKFYEHVVNCLVNLNSNCFGGKMGPETERMKIMYQHNVKSLEHLRGYIVPAVYKVLHDDKIETSINKEEGFRLAFILGWVIEFFHAAICVTSNIMDGRAHLNGIHSKKDKRLPAWHEVENVGMDAVNDAFMLRMAVHNLLKVNFSQLSLFHELEDLSRDANHRNLCGRILHERMKKCEDVSESYTMENYRSVINQQMSYYSFYLPVAFALTLAGKRNEITRDLKEIMLEIGYYYELGLSYSKIFPQERKCAEDDEKVEKMSWLFVRATEKLKEEGNNKQISNLVALVNENDMNSLQKIYHELGLQKDYQDERETTLKRITKLVDNLPCTVKDVVARIFL